MLWTMAGVSPPAARLLVSGRGMAITLRQAHERQAYTLTDEATFWQLQRQVDLVVLSAGDDLLVNTYAVVHPRGAGTAAVFAEWLTRGEGRTRIEDHLIDGRVAFSVWPEGCADDAPAAMPCPQ
jgi:tungstate transport system substrate-binding protein